MSEVSKCVQKSLTGKVNPDLTEEKIDEMRAEAFPSKFQQFKKYLWNKMNQIFNTQN